MTTHILTGNFATDEAVSLDNDRDCTGEFSHT
jgi:hypothetical protein